MVKIIKIKMYRTYMFKGQDPVIKNFKSLMEKQESNLSDISKKSSVSRSTMTNWLNGTTKRPQFSTINAAARSMGFSYEPQKMKRK